MIRLQLLLLGFLGLAVIDFLLGSLWTVDSGRHSWDVKLAEHGVGHFSAARFQANAKPHYEAVNCTEVVALFAPHSYNHFSYHTLYSLTF